MIEWALIAAYAVGWAWAARRLSVAILEQEAAREKTTRDEWEREFKRPHRHRGAPLVDSEGRVMSLVFGSLAALVWPAALLVAVIAPRLRAPSEVADAERAELDALRKLAREHGLPLPGTDESDR